MAWLARAGNFLASMLSRWETTPAYYAGDLLAELIAAGGALTLDDGDPRLACDQYARARRLKLIRVASGGAWSTSETITITTRGREAYAATNRP